MNDVTVLESLKQYMQREVADKITLLKPPAEDEDASVKVHVNPYVCIGYLPPKNFLPEGYDIPGIIVGMEEGQDDGNDADLQIRITFATYGAGNYDADGNLIPDMQGYIDLLNVIGMARRVLSSHPLIDQNAVADKPFRWGLYQEQPWPYWYGWLTFPANIMVQDMVNSSLNQYL